MDCETVKNIKLKKHHKKKDKRKKKNKRDKREKSSERVSSENPEEKNFESKYTCIEAIDGGILQCVVMPSIWLSEDKKSFNWPVTTSRELFDELFFSCASQFQFKTYQVEKIHCCSTTFDEANTVKENIEQNKSKCTNEKENMKSSAAVEEKSINEGLFQLYPLT